ncbi:single-stranded nucleic acid binding R3H domain-containing protein [Thalassoporum mexicanum PCC 7367]|uniref:R3H domain-containing nucleic acid-binding protein n=1 Tax=Thalassoporum mexicanum TaxID=3457544 RepID=UPI00029FB909|nr:R3H domain-containing nucleic acid-binding protein [Pseudanabaena sp. PCC 7367]AFY70103.1 single-stranded nucleic acid binding R3H domain-containing protein [Pseudanabaena sp. PCC 7367]
MTSVFRKQVTDNIEQLLAILPPHIRENLEQKKQIDDLVEVVLDLGRPPEARYTSAAVYLSDTPVTQADIDACVDRVGEFGGDNRAGIERTLHRISAIRNRRGKVIGLTCRVGRAVYGTSEMIRDLVETGKSILIMGRPGMGKTTALREVARVLADEMDKRVVIIDTSNEIAGDGDIPHPAIGRARRMQVAKPELQHQVMVEAVENHMPEVIIIDEIGTELEALAARTIAERGVQLVGTAHGNKLANLIKNPTLSDLIGGIQSVTLGDDEARRRGTQKSILERKAPPTFEIAIEMGERYRWAVHEDVTSTIDGLLRGREPALQIRALDEVGKLTITNELPKVANLLSNPVATKGWRSSGRMKPLPHHNSAQSYSQKNDLTEVSGGKKNDVVEQFFGGNGEERGARSGKQKLQQVESGSYAASLSDLGNNLSLDEQLAPEAYLAASAQDAPPYDPAERDYLYVYLYGVSRHQAEQVIATLKLPAIVTKDIDSADVVLALRSHVRNNSKIRNLATSRQVPIHAVKSSTISQITRALRRILQIDEPAQVDEHDLQLFAYGDSEDEMEALEEARLAVEQIVIPKGQPVELLPRSPIIRKMQHELVEHYHLKSNSFGNEPNRRLRIYPG